MLNIRSRVGHTVKNVSDIKVNYRPYLVKQVSPVIDLKLHVRQIFTLLNPLLILANNVTQEDCAILVCLNLVVSQLFALCNQLVPLLHTGDSDIYELFLRTVSSIPAECSANTGIAPCGLFAKKDPS